MKSKMKKIKAIIILSTLSINILFAQHQNVIIGNSLGYGVPSEASVIINPSNTDEIMVGAMSNNYYISNNGGSSWSHGFLQSPWGVQADPCVLIDNSSRYYYMHLPDVMECVVCHRRDNISEPWSMESTVAYNGNEEVDKEWATYDPVTTKAVYIN